MRISAEDQLATGSSQGTRLGASGLVYLLTVALFSGSLASCATAPFPKPKIRARIFGEVDAERDARIAKIIDATEAVEGVRILEGTIPEGITLSDNGNMITIEEGYRDRYETLGAAEAQIVWPDGYFFQNVYWTTADYQESWRFALCWPQAPLKLLSMGIWNLVPISWPCWMVGEQRNENERRKILMDGLAKAVKVMGGNLLLITGYGNTVTTTISAQTGAQIGQSVTPATGMGGFAIKVNTGEAEAEAEGGDLSL